MIGAGVAARLAVGFLAVALLAVGVLAGLTVSLESSDLSSLTKQQATDLARSVATASAVAYREHGSWSGVDLSDALAVGSEAGGQVTITDGGGLVVSQRSPSGRDANPILAMSQAQVVVDGQDVGDVTVSVGSRGFGLADDRLRHSLGLGLAGSVAATALLAIATSIVVSRRITRPLGHIARVARAMAQGNRLVRVGVLRGPRELAELSAAYDLMADAVAREDRLRRAVVADVAHELRTPVSILLATSESLLDGIRQPSIENLSSIRDEALRLSARIEDLETLSSARAAGLNLRSGPVDLAQVADQAASAVADRFEAAGVSLQRVLASTWVAGDPRRLHQVVTNLLINAAKYTPKGGSVGLEVASRDGLAKLTVTDSGPGIPAEELDHVFERFWRGRSAAGLTGSGIGLAVVDELVRAHHGSVAVTSVPGEGCQFTVALPERASPA